VCNVPEGEFRLAVQETSGPGRIHDPNGDGYLPSAGPWIIRRFSSTLVQPFKGQYGPLAFHDPWWTVVAWIIAAIAAIAAVILATRGQGSAKAGIQCDYDEKTGQATNCRTPDPQPTTGKSEITAAGIASSIASTAAKVGCADDIDPWRRGQEATPVADDETTLSEIVTVELTPLDDMVAGEEFTVRANWHYTRITDQRTLEFAATDERKNTALAGAKGVHAPSPVRVDERSVPIGAEVSDKAGRPYKSAELYVTIIIKPPTGTGGEFLLVCEDQDSSGIFRGTFDLMRAVSEIRETGGNYLGDWRLYLIAQNVNLASPHLPPEEAAQFIGGSPVAAPISVVLKPVACPVAAPDALMTVVNA
jgi:hypothetical protein